MQLIEYPPQHIWTPEGRRYYKTPMGNLPGVSTILNATLDTSFLQAWRSRKGEEEAERICQAAQERGNAIHDAVQNYFLHDKQPQNLDAITGPYWDSLYTFLQQVEDAYLIEGSVWSRWLYAGTIDAILCIGGETYIVDWKTSSKPKDKGNLARYYLQCAAYCGAANFTYQKEGVVLKKAKVVVALSDRPAQVIDISPQQTKRNWKAWLNKVRAFQQIVPTQHHQTA